MFSVPSPQMLHSSRPSDRVGDSDCVGELVVSATGARVGGRGVGAAVPGGVGVAVPGDVGAGDP